MTDYPILLYILQLLHPLGFPWTDIAPVDQWYVEISMFHGYEALYAKAQLLETLKGTLLDVARGEGDVL